MIEDRVEVLGAINQSILSAQVTQLTFKQALRLIKK